MGNFINAPYTVAVRHQQLQCYYNLNQEVIGKEWECGPSDTVSTDVLSGLGLEMSLVSEPLQVCTANNVIYCIHYSCGSFLQYEVGDL